MPDRGANANVVSSSYSRPRIDSASSGSGGGTTRGDFASFSEMLLRSNVGDGSGSGSHGDSGWSSRHVEYGEETAEVGSQFSRLSGSSADRHSTDYSMPQGGGIGSRRFSSNSPRPIFTPASFSATSSSIRSSTARLADLASRSPGPMDPAQAHTGPTRSASIAAPGFSQANDGFLAAPPLVPHAHSASGILTLATQPEGGSPSSVKSGSMGPSGLSMMLAQSESGQTSPSATGPGSFREGSSFPRESSLGDKTPRAFQAELDDEDSISRSITPTASRLRLAAAANDAASASANDDSTSSHSQATAVPSSSSPTVAAKTSALENEDDKVRAELDERTPLLAQRMSPTPVKVVRRGSHDLVEISTREDTPSLMSSIRRRIKNRPRFERPTAAKVLEKTVKEPIALLPAVILGLLLNVLDGVSYGMITFPANAIFTDFGSIGVSMFFMSCIISQLTYTLGGSIFKAGNGSMMIECVPFFHIIAGIITAEVGEDKPEIIIPTTILAFAFSAILTGFVFMFLGTLRLGVLVGFFPRHILVGAIGGVGAFLIQTGFEVAAGIEGEGLQLDHATKEALFGNWHNVALWLIPLSLAILLRLITAKFHHELIFPAYFLIIPSIFYTVIAIVGVDFATLRESGWVFDVGKNVKPWYTFYTLYDFRQTHWGAFWAALPTQLALVFFGILHVPLNVPALGVTLNEDNIKLDRELIAHGVSNILAGLGGTVPNYMCYVNSVLFYRVGGGSRLSGLLLAAATAGVMFAGPSIIGYLPVMVVGALIFVLGIDLAKEAVWDTRKKVNRLEYVTIVAITLGMVIWDFVVGLFIGIIFASIFFVYQSSRRKAIRAVFSGSDARSTVRRPQSQRAFIKDVGQQTQVIKLQGFLFFGTISAVEDEIRRLLDVAAWHNNPIRYLIVDMWLVNGIDFSSAEAFVRIQRLLAAKGVTLIFCGCDPNRTVGRALRGVDLWTGQNEGVEVFDELNEALEWTENKYLSAYYLAHKKKVEEQPRDLPTPQCSPAVQISKPLVNTPRAMHLAEAGNRSSMLLHPTDDQEQVTASDAPGSPMEPAIHRAASLSFDPPLAILTRIFSAYTDGGIDLFHRLAPYFQQIHVKTGELIWDRDEEADGMYLIESGVLKAIYEYAEHTRIVTESMVAGSVAGELSFMSRTKRNAKAFAETDSVLWKLDVQHLEKMEQEKPDAARALTQILLRITAEEHEVLSSHLVAVLS